MTKYLFLILVILLPLQFALNISANIDLVTTRIIVPVLFLLWLIGSLARKKIWLPNRAEMWLVVAFLFLSALSLIFGRDAGAGFRKLLYFLTIFPIFFVAADILRDEIWRRKTVSVIIWSGVLAALIGLSQFIFSFLISIDRSIRIWESLAPYFLGNSFGKLVAANSSWLVNVGGKTRLRAFGLFPDPHNFAFFVDLCLFVGIGFFFSQKKAGSRIWTGAAVALMMAAVALSFSRGAYLGLIAGAIFFAAIFLKRTNLLGKALMGTVAILILLFVYNSNIITQRLASSFNLKEGSNAERYKNWVQAAEIVGNDPVSGVGLGNYARAIDATASERSSIYAHNLFLDIAAETGLLNSAVFLVLIMVSVWHSTRSGRLTQLGLAAGLVGFFVHSIFDTALYSPQVLTIFLIIVALGIPRVHPFAKIENEKIAV